MSELFGSICSASSYLAAAARQSLPAYSLFPSLKAFMARTSLTFPHPASASPSPATRARHAAEDRILIVCLSQTGGFDGFRTDVYGPVSTGNWSRRRESIATSLTPRNPDPM